MSCASCNGDGGKCKACNGRGSILITDCPWKLTDNGALQAMKFVRLAEEHNWPLSGGVLDQTKSFVDFYDLCASEKRRWEQEMSNK
jgi:hypothetical protein